MRELKKAEKYYSEAKFIFDEIGDRINSEKTLGILNDIKQQIEQADNL